MPEITQKEIDYILHALDELKQSTMLISADNAKLHAVLSSIHGLCVSNIGSHDKNLCFRILEIIKHNKL